MSTSSISLPASRRVARARARSLAWPPPELAALLALAAVLYLWSLGRNGFANEYYSAAVRSMTQSWHAFLFGSFDTGGVMTVDKPPLALWVQALSARAFGYSSWSMLVPQALMGVASVALVYDMTRRQFGRAAGFGAGLALALTPIAVAISRHNNPDALLVLCVTAAVWCLVRGLEDGRTRWLVLSGVCVGLGFEAKMGAALLVVPAIAAAWLWVAPRGRVAALRQLGLGGAAMAVVGLAWPVLVWLTPASDRPWISGTSDNSIWSLIFGYNGLGRLTGQQGAPGGGGPGGGGGGGAFGGDTGVLRLLNESLGGQGGWLLGFALVAGIGVVAVSRLRRDDPRTGWIVAVGGVFLTTAVAFSQASGIFHPYYVSQLAPFTAALVGAGIGVMVRGGLPARIVGPLAIGAGIVTELVVLGENPGQLEWVPAAADRGRRHGRRGAGARPEPGRAGADGGTGGGMAVLMLAPGAWAFQTLGHATSGTFPAGGPASAGFGGPGGRGFAGGGGPGGPGAGMAPPATGAPGPARSPQGGRPRRPPQGGFGGATWRRHVRRQHAVADRGARLRQAERRRHARRLQPVRRRQPADRSGSDVAAIGGFSGRESQVSVEWLADAVQDGRIRWVLTDGSSGGLPQDGRIGSTEVMAAAAEVGTSTSIDGLYDLQGHAAELRALAG